jgi:predicted DNA-binding protein
MGRRKIPAQFYLDADQKSRLSYLANKTLVPISVYFREAVDLIIKRLERERSKDK